MLKNIGNSRGFISLDNVCYFPPYTAPVFCAELPVTGAEFANAGMMDIRAAVTLVIDSECDDADETTLRYNGKTYAIYRRYLRADGLCELHLNARAGVS